MWDKVTLSHLKVTIRRITLKKADQMQFITIFQKLCIVSLILWYLVDFYLCLTQVIWKIQIARIFLFKSL